MARGWLLAAGATIPAAGLLLALRGHERSLSHAPPFRLGQALIQDLQTTVGEVGVVDPTCKVEVKGAVSGRVMSIRVREGDTVGREILLDGVPFRVVGVLVSAPTIFWSHLLTVA